MCLKKKSVYLMIIVLFNAGRCDAMFRLKEPLKKIFYFQKLHKSNLLLDINSQPFEDAPVSSPSSNQPKLLQLIQKEQQRIDALRLQIPNIDMIVRIYAWEGLEELEKGYYALSKERQEIFEFVLFKHISQEVSFHEQDDRLVPANIQELSRWLHEILHRKHSSF